MPMFVILSVTSLAPTLIRLLNLRPFFLHPTFLSFFFSVRVPFSEFDKVRECHELGKWTKGIVAAFFFFCFSMES